jgi:hypothetical protein
VVLCAALFLLSESTVAADSRCSAGSPDSPVNYSGGHPRIPESGWFGVYGPGAPDTVRWQTGQSGAPIFSTLNSFCSVSNCVPNLNLVFVCVEPYAPVIHEF